MQHTRIKPKAKAAPDAEERRHIERVAALGCLVCRRPAAIHHVMKAPGKVRRRDHRFVVPLCGEHHQGNEGVHGLGSEALFFERWRVDLVAWCIRAWGLRDAPEDAFWGQGVTR